LNLHRKGGNFMEGKKSRKEVYIKGYDDAERDLGEKEGLKHYIDGYKAGYRDGYQAVMEILKGMMTPEMQQKMIEEGAQLAWPPRW
jgi:hypothetical protein